MFLSIYLFVIALYYTQRMFLCRFVFWL